MKSESVEALELKLEDDSFGDGFEDYKIRWFFGGREVTKRAQQSSYRFTLRPDQRRIFEGTVKGDSPDPGALCLAPRFTVRPDGYDVPGGVYINDEGVCG